VVERAPDVEQLGRVTERPLRLGHGDGGRTAVIVQP
jgi:hypothetical protein